MSDSKFMLVFAILMSVIIIAVPAYAKKIKGDPELIWLSPLGDSDIENNAYNRCRLIRTVKPGAGETSKITKNKFDILSTYASNLYAQSLKIAGYIESEKEDNTPSTADLSNEKTLIDEEITKRLGDISRRMNIINAFEAGTMLLESLSVLYEQQPETYSDFRVLKNGSFVYSTDCEDLK